MLPPRAAATSFLHPHYNLHTFPLTADLFPASVLSQVVQCLRLFQVISTKNKYNMHISNIAIPFSQLSFLFYFFNSSFNQQAAKRGGLKSMFDDRLALQQPNSDIQTNSHTGKQLAFLSPTLAEVMRRKKGRRDFLHYFQETEAGNRLN